MRTISTLKAFFLLVLLVPFLASCGDDTVGPDDADYPVTMVAKSIENKSTIRAFVREGDNWREITSENPDVLTNEFFAEATVITAEEDPNIILKSATEWTAAPFSDTAFSYTYSGGKFTFTIPLLDINLYATGDYSKFKAHMVAGVTEGMTARISYVSGNDPLTALTSGFLPFPTAEGTIIAYQTFDIGYEAE